MSAPATSVTRPASPAWRMFTGLPSLLPLVFRVGALARFGFNVLADQCETFSFGEALNRGALRLDPEPGALLLPSRDTVVGNSAAHTKCIPPFALSMNAQS